MLVNFGTCLLFVIGSLMSRSTEAGPVRSPHSGSRYYDTATIATPNYYAEAPNYYPAPSYASTTAAPKYYTRDTVQYFGAPYYKSADTTPSYYSQYTESPIYYTPRYATTLASIYYTTDAAKYYGAAMYYTAAKPISCDGSNHYTEAPKYYPTPDPITKNGTPSSVTSPALLLASPTTTPTPTTTTPTPTTTTPAPTTTTVPTTTSPPPTTTPAPTTTTPTTTSAAIRTGPTVAAPPYYTSEAIKYYVAPAPPPFYYPDGTYYTGTPSASDDAHHYLEPIYSSFVSPGYYPEAHRSAASYYDAEAYGLHRYSKVQSGQARDYASYYAGPFKYVAQPDYVYGRGH